LRLESGENGWGGGIESTDSRRTGRLAILGQMINIIHVLQEVPKVLSSKEPAAVEPKKAKRRKRVGGSEEALLLAQHARQRLSQILREQKEARDKKSAAWFETDGEKRIAELESQARKRLEEARNEVVDASDGLGLLAGALEGGFGLESAEEKGKELVVGGFTMEGGSLAVSLQPPGTENPNQGKETDPGLLPEVAKVKSEPGQGGVDNAQPAGVGMRSGQQGGMKKPQKRKVTEGPEEGDPPRGKKQRSSHREVRHAVRMQMAVKPSKESSRGVESPGERPPGAKERFGPAMWSEKWWLQKWRKEERTAKGGQGGGRDDGASSGEDVPIGRALINKGKVFPWNCRQVSDRVR
jgi:hypothetical protein